MALKDWKLIEKRNTYILWNHKENEDFVSIQQLGPPLNEYGVKIPNQPRIYFETRRRALSYAMQYMRTH